jgi:hypothetical protein
LSYNLGFCGAVQAKEFLMSLNFPFGRTALALCVGSLFAAASASADELASRPANEASTLSTKSINLHLANTLAEDSVIRPLPRYNERYSFDGKVRTYVVPVRPAIDNPMNGYSRFDSSSFRRDTVTAEFSNLGWLQAAYKRLAAD